MKNCKVQDERILAERREIQSRGYAWIVIILLVSIIVQQFFMQAPFKQYAVEFFILIGSGIYNIAANYFKGIDVWNPRGYGKKKILLNTFVTGIVAVILFAFLSGNYQINSLAIYFATFVAFFYILYLIMIGVNNKKQRAIDKELNDEDVI